MMLNILCTLVFVISCTHILAMKGPTEKGSWALLTELEETKLKEAGYQLNCFELDDFIEKDGAKLTPSLFMLVLFKRESSSKQYHFYELLKKFYRHGNIESFKEFIKQFNKLIYHSDRFAAFYVYSIVELFYSEESKPKTQTHKELINGLIQWYFSSDPTTTEKAELVYRLKQKNPTIASDENQEFMDTLKGEILLS